MNEKWEIEDIIPVILTENGTYYDSEIVKLTCPACGESFKGIKREAGGFIAGHKTYHEFVNAQDIIVEFMGGI